MNNSSTMLFSLLLVFTLIAPPLFAETKADERPNILFAIADDWGWPHAGSYGDPVVKTPTFDTIAKSGVLFHHAYISSPSCTPSRNAILTGQYHWRLGTGANLWSTFDKSLKTYPLLMEKAGYHVGRFRKSWGPGKLSKDQPHPAGSINSPITKFLANRPKDKPFCFWFGSSDPHRGYKLGSGKASGMDLAKIELFPFFPDSKEIRSDVADYYWEVQRFDREVGQAISELKKNGLLENTIIVMTGDHGMPFPRCKSNVYDSGARIPLAVQWPAKMKASRVVNDFVSTTDLAPTFLAAAGIDIPKEMTGRSLMNVFTSAKQDRIDPQRDVIYYGKERHVPSQEAPDSGGYPMRAIRTHDYLYIWNITPKRWPNGTPNYKKAFKANTWYGDTDNGPTKSYIVANKDKDDHHAWAYQQSFGMRPSEELFDLKKDPHQLANVADKEAYAKVKAQLKSKLMSKLSETKDPRVTGGGENFDTYPYLGGGPRFPGRSKKKSKK